MKQIGRGILCAGLAVVLCTLSTAAFAQGEPPTSSNDLMLQIESLKERISQLEDQVNNMGPGMDPAVASRLDALEAELAKKEEKAANDFRVFWKDSLRFETEDGRFKLRIGGRMHIDWSWFSQDEDTKFLWAPGNTWGGFGNGNIVYQDLEDGVEFRRVRMYLSGSVWENIDFKLQLDFAGGDAVFKDVYMEFTDLPVAKLRVGQFKEPFSLNEVTSSNDITFMERALPNALVPGRNTGVMVHNTALDGMLGWQAGVFKNSSDQGLSADDGHYAYTGRIYGTPWKADDDKLIHLGAAYSHREIETSWPGNPMKNRLRYRQRPEMHLMGTRPIDTGNLLVDEENLWNLEAALVYGPFSVQGEYINRDVDGFLGEGTFDGWYAFASYILTGESRRYDNGSGRFKAPKPANNFSMKDGGWGAWEVAVRYSTIDLSDGPYFGGEMDNWTAGVNWYLNPNTRIMFNYVHSEVDHALYDGDIDGFMTRFQFAF